MTVFPQRAGFWSGWGGFRVGDRVGFRKVLGIVSRLGGGYSHPWDGLCRGVFRRLLAGFSKVERKAEGWVLLDEGRIEMR